MSEKIYACCYCNYKTTKRQYWYSHLKTNKHKRNELKSNEHNDIKKNTINDSINKNHDSINKNHDSINKNHDSINKNHDSINENHDSINENHDSINENNLSVEKRVDSIIEVIKDGKKKFKCNFCFNDFTQLCNLYRHRKACKKKILNNNNGKIIIENKSGIYCMWNKRMVDEDGNNYYKLGRKSKKESMISVYAKEYNLSIEEILFIHEVDFEDEVFTEKLLFNILQDYNIDKTKNVYNALPDMIMQILNKLGKLLSDYKINKNKEIIEENINLLLNDIDCPEVVHIKGLINNDYEIIKHFKLLKCKLSKNKNNNNINENADYKKQNIIDEQMKLIKQMQEDRKFLIEHIVGKKGESIDEIRDELKEELKKFVQDTRPYNLNQNYQTRNNSGTYFEATNQNNLLNNLNLNYNNVISMDKFIHNMEHVHKIPKCDLEAIAYASENMTEGDLAETIHKTLEKNCLQQTKGVINPADGLELLPVIPVVCSDGNCRSHKEKVNQFWETVYGDKHFDQMLDVIDKRLYEVLKKKIYLEEYGKKKLFKKIKRKHTIHDMKKFQEKINGPLDEKAFKSISI